jgi:hypothetical protein
VAFSALPKALLPPERGFGFPIEDSKMPVFEDLSPEEKRQLAERDAWIDARVLDAYISLGAHIMVDRLRYGILETLGPESDPPNLPAPRSK